MTDAPDYRAIFDALPGIYLVVDPDYVIVAANEARLQATLTTREQVVGRPLFDMFPDNPDDPATQGVRNLRASLDRVRRDLVPDAMPLQKYDIPRKGGAGFEERWWSPLNVPVVGPDGQLLYIVHQVEDVTDLVKRQVSQSEAREERLRLRTELDRRAREVADAARDLKEANAELARLYEQADTARRVAEESVRIREQVVGIVAHDLRDPVVTIGLTAEHLRRTLGDHASGTVRAQLDVIDRSVDRANGLLRDVLDLARMKAGGLVVERSTVDVPRLVQDLLGQYRAQATQRQVRLDAALGDDLVPLHADRRRLVQLLGNLVGNALKFVPTGGRITVRVSREPSALHFEVIGTGPGIPEEQRAHLFEPFWRAEDSPSTGAGLGLAISHGIVEAHGGEIWVESAVGRGTTVHVRLPVGG